MSPLMLVVTSLKAVAGRVTSIASFLYQNAEHLFVLLFSVAFQFAGFLSWTFVLTLVGTWRCFLDRWYSNNLAW